jgi:hypothetical protein
MMLPPLHRARITLRSAFCLAVQVYRGTWKGAFEVGLWGVIEGFMRYGGVMAKPPDYSLNDSIQATTMRRGKPRP